MTDSPYKNMRDLGGLKCPAGVIKQNMIFRAPRLTGETAEEREYLDTLAPDCIIDLRSREEQTELPDYVPEGTRLISAPALKPGEYKYIIVTTKAKLSCLFLKGRAINRLYEEKERSYREMPFEKAAFEKIFDCMDKGLRFVFHCTEGKDRTGVAAALTELSLGRSEQEITEEYLLSNELRPRKDRSSLRFFGASARLIDAIAYCESTHEELIKATFDCIKAQYGDTAAFLRELYGVTDERLEAWQRLYTE